MRDLVHRLSAVAVLVVLCGDGRAGDPPAGTRVERLIRELNSPKFAERERAERELWNAGEAAVPALQDALRGPPEAALRAGKLLERIRSGLRPDTPEEVVEAISRYRAGDAEARREALDAIFERGEYEVVVGLVTTPGSRREATRSILPEGFLDRLGARLIPQGEEGRLERLLWRLAERGDREVLRCLTAVLVLTGRDGEEAGRLERGDRPALPRRDELRMMLLRANGEDRELLAHAERCGDGSFADDARLRLGLWGPLAATLPDQGDSLPTRAMLLDFAGDPRGAELLDELARAAVRSGASIRESARAREAFRALLLGGRWDDGRAIAAGGGDLPAFQLQRARGDYGAAFRQIGLDPGSDAEGWFAGAMDATSGGRESCRVVLTALEAAEALRDLGASDAADTLLDAVTRKVLDAHFGPPADGAILETLRAVGDFERAAGFAALRLDGSPSERQAALAGLFQDRADEAWRLVGLFRRSDGRSGPDADIERLRRVAGLLNPSAGGPSVERELDGLAAAVGRRADEGPAEYEATVRAVVEVFETRGREPPGHLLRSVPVRAAGTTELLATADQAFAAGEWERAARLYRLVSLGRPSEALPLFLWGEATARAGNIVEGDEFRRRAVLLPLADEFRRFSLAEELARRGLRDAAAEQWRLVLRLGNAWDGRGTDVWASNALLRLLNHDAIRADRRVWAWRAAALGLIDTIVSDEEQLIKIPCLVAREQTLGLRNEDRIEEAAAAAFRAVELLPTEIDFPCAIVPSLRRAGAEARADQLFDRAYAAHAAVLESWPGSARHHAEAALLVARCGGPLDRALRHAEAAVALRPGKAGYLAVLAEVRFRRGERAAALEEARRCVELAPGNLTFGKLLGEILRSGPIEAARP